jgi:hypothetical protein
VQECAPTRERLVLANTAAAHLTNRDIDEREQQSNDAEQELDKGLELQHPYTECPLILAEELRCDDGSRTSPNPTRRRGAREPQLSEESRVTLLGNKVTQAM